MSIAPEAETIVVPETGVTINVRPYPLPLAAPYTAQLYVGDSADGISQSLRAGNYGSPPTYDLLPALAPAGGKVLDLGAHIGTFTVMAATWGYELLAVEASPENAAILQHSIDANALTQRAQVIRAAVGDRIGFVEFIPAGPFGAVANSHLPNATMTVPLTTVTQILAEQGWTRVDLIKLDVEGSEIAALRGMSDLLKQSAAPPILVESNGHTLDFFDETPQHLLQQLHELGYRCYLLHDNGQLEPVNAGYCQPAVCVDYLATKQPLPPELAQRVAPAVETAALVEQLVAASHDGLAHLRQHVARTLATMPASFLANMALIETLDRLVQDPDPAVRAAADWWDDGTMQSRSRAIMRHLIQMQTEEIKQLRATPTHRARAFFDRWRQKML